MVREALLSWKGPLHGEKAVKNLELCSPRYIWKIWKKRNRIAFRDGILVVQRLKHSFVSNLWSWNS